MVLPPSLSSYDGIIEHLEKEVAQIESGSMDDQLDHLCNYFIPARWTSLNLFSSAQWPPKPILDKEVGTGDSGIVAQMAVSEVGGVDYEDGATDEKGCDPREAQGTPTAATAATTPTTPGGRRPGTRWSRSEEGGGVDVDDASTVVEKAVKGPGGRPAKRPRNDPSNSATSTSTGSTGTGTGNTTATNSPGREQPSTRRGGRGNRGGFVQEEPLQEVEEEEEEEDGDDNDADADDASMTSAPKLGRRSSRREYEPEPTVSTRKGKAGAVPIAAKGKVKEEKEKERVPTKGVKGRPLKSAKAEKEKAVKEKEKEAPLKKGKGAAVVKLEEDNERRSSRRR